MEMWIRGVRQVLFPEYYGTGQEQWLPALGQPERLRVLLRADLQAAWERDPAAESMAEIALCYPGFFGVTVYRMAHFLHSSAVPLLPRQLTEYAHCVTGIDIHPGAVIGGGFFVDHGTGVVIGETAVLGENVTLYQGVTLGALCLEEGRTLRGRKRHPTLEDGVTVYANATILGGETVVGERSVVGANAFVTASVPPDTTIPACRSWCGDK